MDLLCVYLIWREGLNCMAFFKRFMNHGQNSRKDYMEDYNKLHVSSNIFRHFCYLISFYLYAFWTSPTECEKNVVKFVHFEGLGSPQFSKCWLKKIR